MPTQDLHHQLPATAIALGILAHRLLGAGATAFAAPMIGAICLVWTGASVAAVWLAGAAGAMVDICQWWGLEAKRG